MDKKATIGKYFYYATLIISIALLVIAFFVLNVKDIEDEEEIITRYIYRYMIIDFILFILIPIGGIVREVCLENHRKNLIIIKVLVSVLGGIGAILLVYFLRDLLVAKVSTFVAMLVLVFSVSPTVKETKKWDLKEYTLK